ncbi:MAG: PaaI family thioesterase [Acidaminococcaceae bacterium]|jgi:acyl-CoA thioesterase|nr:PaaI family thioesterase [Acidaminococcaceae bacterium]MCI2110435.1 PaaI family thioesterase [Acidaminococcaceae bacterium]
MNHEEQMAFANEKNLFMIHNNIKGIFLSDERAKVRGEINSASLNAMGGIHGGFLYLMGDCAAGLLARSTGHTFVTLNSTFRYLRDGRDAKVLIAESSLVKRGKTVTVIRTVVKTETSDKTLAEGEFTFFCVDK